MVNAMIIDEKDTVAVAIEPIEKGAEVCYKAKDGSEKKLTAEGDIQIYHKIAIKAMKQGDPVVKYGEHIGVAGCDIVPGTHVHTHNVESKREDLH